MLGDNNEEDCNIEYGENTENDEIIAEVITILDNEDPFDDSVIEK